MAISSFSAAHRRYHFESERLRSFQAWPNTSPMHPSSLAKAGFYYTGHLDLVQCYSCGISMCGWTLSDKDPMREHYRWSSTCQFVTSQQYHTPDRHLSRTPLCRCHECLAINNPQKHRESGAMNLGKLWPLGLMQVKPPVHPDWAMRHNRLKTFENWTIYDKSTLEKLVDAGFYSLKKDRWICCYQCNVCLNDWDASEDIWQKHARLSPNCYFLLLMKGCEFVNTAVATKRPKTNPTQVSLIRHKATG